MARLDLIARVLSSSLIPKKISGQIWDHICRANIGKKFVFTLKYKNKKIMYGGVCGVSNNALFFKLEKYEKELFIIYKSILEKETKPIFLDVGANNGQSLLVIKSQLKDAEIHCFEPFTKLTELIQDICLKNGWSSTVKINNKLLGESQGLGKLHFSTGATVTASTVAGFQSSYDDFIHIPQCTLDDYVEENKIAKVSLIKIDVEGGELEVLKGAYKILEKMHPPIILELLYTKHEHHLYRQKTTINILKSLGYKFYHIREGGKLHYQDFVTPDSTYRYLNYLVLHTSASLP